MSEKKYEKYCCIDCRYLKFPFEVDETEVPKPTNPYCTKGNDKHFPKIQSKILEWINFPEYEKHICPEFKLSWWIRLGLRKTYKEHQQRWDNDCK